MQRWEHMALHVVIHEGDVAAAWTAQGPDYRHEDLDDRVNDYRSGDEGARLLDQFGANGWELGGTDVRVTGTSYERTFWLKRPSEH